MFQLKIEKKLKISKKNFNMKKIKYLIGINEKYFYYKLKKLKIIENKILTIT